MLLRLIRFIKGGFKINKDALGIITECIETQNPMLDLGNLGLTDKDFKVYNPISKALSQCTHLQTLILSNNWREEGEDAYWDESNHRWISGKRSTGPRNALTILPPAVASLTNLSRLYCAGGSSANISLKHEWDIVDIDCISGLVNLTHLDLKNNRIRKIKALKNLNNLQKLELRHNRIEEIIGLESLTRLHTLNLSRNRISDISPISKLIALHELNISSNDVIEINALEHLTAVHDLDMSSNEIIEIGVLEHLTALRNLQLSSNNIEKISGLEKLSSLKFLSLLDNNIKEIEGLQNLKVLEYLDLSLNKITEIKGLETLIGLKTLRLISNQIKAIKGIDKLIYLQSLFLQENHIEDVKGLEQLINLQRLNLYKNPIADAGPLLPFLKRQKQPMKFVTFSSLGGGEGEIVINPRTPPAEIIGQGNEAVIRFFLEREIQGEEKLYEAKIVIVGSGESGKTTLVKKMIDPSHQVPNAEDQRTQGINITPFSFGIEKDGALRNLKAHIWDFGGQELYHTTHQLFLTPDTLYILLNDNRKNDTDFYYWLNIVAIRANKNCPLLVVFNAKNNSPRQIVLHQELYTAFNYLLPESIDINFADSNPDAINRMKAVIGNYFSNLDVLGKSFPAYWVKVREEIGRQKEEHITWSQFVKICEEKGVRDLPQIRILVQTLHNLGVLLFFQDVFGLEDLIILNIQWCIDAIYTALDTPEVCENSGRFDEVLLARKWAGSRFSGNYLQLLKLMQHFDLCYRVDGMAEYIAPQLLSVNEKRFPDFPHKNCITYRFEYTFMPAGIITRLIARLSRHILDQYVWRGGVTLKWDEGTIAEIVENQFSREIVIRVAGKERKRRLSEIRKTLHALHGIFRGLKFTEVVSCNCKDCLNSNKPTSFSLESLEDDAKYNEQVKCKNGTRKMVLARQILEGVEYIDTTRIFISYSHKNEVYKNEFRKMIRPLEKEGHWKVWDDKWLLPGDNWNREIIRHLSEANVIILMITPDFLNSDYIYDIEMSRAIQRHETGDALVIGIIISECMWKVTPLHKIQMIPRYDMWPIDQQKDRNYLWKSIVDEIHKTIEVRQGKRTRNDGWNEEDLSGKRG